MFARQVVQTSHFNVKFKNKVFLMHYFDPSYCTHRCGGLTLMGGAVDGDAVLRCAAPLWTARAGAARALLAGGRHLLHTNTHTHYCQSHRQLPHPTTGPPNTLTTVRNKHCSRQPIIVFYTFD